MNRSGYAQACQDYIFALQKGGYDISLKLLHTNIDRVSVTRERLVKLEEITRPTSDKSLMVYHCIPDMQRRIPCRSKSLGFATFETHRPPEHWATILNQNDGVIVPSEFNRKVFLQAGVIKPIYYLPHCIDDRLYNKDIEPLVKRERFIFLFVGTWKRRKGWKQLIEAWLKEFDIHDDVELMIKTDKLSISQRDIDSVKKELGLNKEFAPISWESRILNEVDLPRLYKSADCYISSTLGEGFGNCGLQSMAVGTPVLITDYSGCQEYAKEETATLIKPNRLIVHSDMDTYPQFSNCVWGNVEAKEVAFKMRYVLNNRDEIKQKAKVAYQFAHEKFSYEKTVKRFDDIVKSVL